MSTSTAANDRLDKLPTEMIHKIYQQLEDDYDRSNFRLVNHELESKSFDAWVNRHPTVSISVKCRSYASQECTVAIEPFHDENGAHKKTTHVNVAHMELRSILLSLPKLSNIDIHMYIHTSLGPSDGRLEQAHVDSVRLLQRDLVDRQVNVLSIQGIIFEQNTHTQLKAMLDTIKPKELVLGMRTQGGSGATFEQVLPRKYRSEFCRVFDGSNLIKLMVNVCAPYTGMDHDKWLRTVEGLRHYTIKGSQKLAVSNYAVKACMKDVLESIENEFCDEAF